VSARRISLYNFAYEPLKTTKKSNFNTSIVKKSKKSCEDYVKEFAGSTQNHKKIIETPNQPIETKNSYKK
jgi:hypothetical protein